MDKSEEFSKIDERKETGTSQWRQPYPTDGLTTDLALTSLQTRFKTIVQSPVFEFLVGGERKPMTIHKALVASQSASLRHLVTGSIEEANSGKVVWEDVDEDTFTLFAEFAYTGDYATALKTGREYYSDFFDRDESYDSDDIDRSGSGIYYREDPFMKELLLRLQHFSEEYGKNKEDVNNESDSPKDCEEDEEDEEDDDNESDEDYPLQQPPPFRKLRIYCPWDPPDIYGAYYLQTPGEQRRSECTSLLSHARVYVLADKYDIPRLKNLVVRKLQKTLSQLIPIEEEFYDYISGLIKFVYENTPTLSATKEPLRQLVTYYVSYVSYPELRLFVKSKRCDTLMQKCEQLAMDLWVFLMKRRDKFWSPSE